MERIKNKIKILFSVLVLLFVFSALPIGTDNNLTQDSKNDTIENNVDELNPKPAKSWVLPYLYIKNNWSAAQSKGWVTGEGSKVKPYIIENMTIDASNSPNDCGIFIENSNKYYFTIRNCTIFNQRTIGDFSGAGIYLKNASLGTIENNNCTNNECGILIP